MRTAFIVNPSSDGGRTGDDWPRLEKKLRRALGPIDVFETTRRGEGTSLAARALAGGANLVVAVGGDGTLGEVVGGFFAESAGDLRSIESPPGSDDARAPRRSRLPHPHAAFSFLQRGTGGDFQRTLGLGKDPDLFCAALAAPAAHTRTIDVGKVTYTTHDGGTASRYFLNIASFGIGGLFDAMLNASKKTLRGRAATTLTGVRALYGYKHQKVSLSLDDGPSRALRIHNVAVANGQYYGGGQHIAPDASLDDGLFDVVLLGDLGVGEKLSFARRIFDAKHLELRKVERARARRLHAAPAPDDVALGSAEARDDTPILLDVDGEQPGRLPATFEIVPGALRLCVPRAAGERAA